MDGPRTSPGAPRNPERDGPPAENGARAGLERLREILVRPETERLDALHERLEDPEIRRNEIAAALPEAVRRAAARDPSLAAALSPLIEKGLAQSIRRNPSVVIEVLFPVLGPAIRRAVASALRGAVESLNRVIEHSFTWRGLRWRLEAWRTGRPVAEVAISRSVVYRVEQALLIHRETGLPLLVVGIDEERRVPDLVSGMLTAIQDFVHDSFSVAADQNLDRLEVGDFQVWIERGPRAVLAAVIRGSAPRRLRTLMAEAIGDVHAQLREPLEHFQGDATLFEPARPLLESCLKQELIRPRKTQGMQPSTVATLALIALLILGWEWLRWREESRWEGYLAALDAEPGLVAVDEGRRGGARRALVLRDPLAADPAAMLDRHGLGDGAAALRVAPIVSSDPEIVVLRARKLLTPPESVNIEVENGTLILSGSAPGAWIREAGRRAPLAAGVEAVRMDGLTSSDRMELDRLAPDIEGLRILFETSSAAIAPSQQPGLDALSAGLREALRLGAEVGVEVRAQILGGSDQSGPEQTNARLRRQRGEAVRGRLLDMGAPAAALSVQSADGDLGDSPERRRSVAVKLEMQEAPASVRR